MNIMLCECVRCGYEWNSKDGEPVSCPKCKSYRWNYKMEVT